MSASITLQVVFTAKAMEGLEAYACASPWPYLVGRRVFISVFAYLKPEAEAEDLVPAHDARVTFKLNGEVVKRAWTDAVGRAGYDFTPEQAGDYTVEVVVEWPA